MSKLFLFFELLFGSLVLHCFVPEISYAQLIDGVASTHIRMRLPVERLALGRDIISEIEQCYLFMNRSLDDSLPRMILLIADWDSSRSISNRHNASIILGMNKPSAYTDPKKYILHTAAREFARLGLQEISGGAEREDTEFIFEGMIELLAHEFERSSRSLESAWIISRYLDDMHQLGFAVQRSWSEFSAGTICLRNSAPGITFLSTFRELHGRNKLLKLFHSLKNTNFLQSLSLTFKTPVTELESIWLKKIREYQVFEEIIISSENAPQLIPSSSFPKSCLPGTILLLQFSISDRDNDLLPNSVFFRDERSGVVIQAQPTSENSNYLSINFPINADCPPGNYDFRLTAVDESGNLRHWTGFYFVVSNKP
jgi:hypothetical protein